MRALIAGSMVVLLAACGKEAVHPPAQAPVEVITQTVVPQDAPAVFEYVGQTESSHQVEIRARVSGFLEKRVYEEGSSVKKGQVLFLMDKKPFEAALSAAKAELAQQESRHTVAQQTLARVKPLAAQNALSQKDLDDAVGQEKNAAAAVEAAKANVINAELNLSYCTIASPVDGLSSFAKQQDGGYISPQTNLLTYVARLSPMRVNFSLSENELLNLRNEAASGKLKVPEKENWVVELVLADGSVFPERGRITFADASFSQETGTYLLRAELPNVKGKLRPGQFVRARLLGATRPGSFVLPQRAVQQGPRGEYVWVVGKDNKAEQRPVVVGNWQGNDWVIRSGLAANEVVVVDGVLKLALAPGMPLKPVERPAAEKGKDKDAPADAKPGMTGMNGMAGEAGMAGIAGAGEPQKAAGDTGAQTAVREDPSPKAPAAEPAAQSAPAGKPMVQKSTESPETKSSPAQKMTGKKEAGKKDAKKEAVAIRPASPATGQTPEKPVDKPADKPDGSLNKRQAVALSPASTAVAVDQETVKVPFSTDRSVPDDEHAKEIKKTAERAISSRSKVVVTGYTDRAGDPSRNVELTHIRTETVAKALQAFGVPPSQIVLRPPVNVTGSYEAGHDDSAGRVDLFLVKP